MSESRITIGLIYSTKVAGTYLPVRIDKSLGHGRYEGASMPGGATVRISTDAIRGSGQTPDAWAKSRETKQQEVLETAAKVASKVLGVPVGVVPAKAKPGKKTGEKKERKTSGLDAAIRVLREVGRPMQIGEIVRIAIEKGYWSSGGKTPQATVSAAVGREIAVKGKDSRFRKASRGHFELTK